jgi:uncharacterized protein (DUF302 family)
MTSDYENRIAAHDQFKEDLGLVMESIHDLLIEKNRKYGNSALAPCRIFAKSDAVEQLRVRIDDKLNRIMNRQADEDEDVEVDLIGYLLMMQIAKRRKRIAQEIANDPS